MSSFNSPLSSLNSQPLTKDCQLTTVDYRHLAINTQNLTLKRLLLKTLVILFCVFIVSFLKVNACEIHFSILSGEKETYSKGDVLIVKVTVLLTHRNCPEGIHSTKFEPKGLEISQATKWKEENSTTFTRKLKLKITTNTKNVIVLNAVRKCDKEGGFGTLVLNKP